MARLQPADQITLSEADRDALQSLVRAHTTPQQIAIRAKIILLADEGVGVRATMRRLGTWDNIVRRWRKRWISRSQDASVAERLSDEPRSGAPTKFTAEQICRIVALACRVPSQDDGPAVSQWSQQALADEAKRQGIVEDISQRSVGRILKRI